MSDELMAKLGGLITDVVAVLSLQTYYNETAESMARLL